MITTAAVLALLAPFTAPVTLSSDVQSSPDASPALAAAPDGSAIASWVEGTTAGPRLALAERDVRGAIRQVDAPPSPASAVVAAAARRGFAAVGWTIPVGLAGRTNLAVAVRSPGRRLGAQRRLTDLHATGGDAGGLSVAMGAAGDAAVAWAEHRPGGWGLVRMAARRPGGRFGAARTITAVAGRVSRPAVAVGSDGAVTVAWAELHDGAKRVLAAAVPRDGGLRRAQVLSQPAQTGAPVLAAAGGRLAVAWGEEDAGRGGAVRFAMLQPGGRFQAPMLERTPGGTPLGVRVAVDPSGRAALAWYGCSRYGACRIWTTRTRRWGGLLPPHALTAAGAVALPDVAMDGRGTVTVAWRRTISSTIGDLVEASRGKAGLGFSSPQRLSTYGRLATPPTVLPGAGGRRSLVAWASRPFGVGGTQLKVASGPPG